MDTSFLYFNLKTLIICILLESCTCTSVLEAVINLILNLDLKDSFLNLYYDISFNMYGLNCTMYILICIQFDEHFF